MEVQTGQILAMVGLERNFEGKLQPCKNFAYQQELGSAAKTVSLLAALETGEVKLTDTVDTGNGLWAVEGQPASGGVMAGVVFHDIMGYNSRLLSA